MYATTALNFRSQKGFTIMEVALAATVLALTLVGMIGVVESGEQMLDVSRKQTLANQILHSELDELRLQNWETVSGFVQISGVWQGVIGQGLPPGPTTLTSSNDPAYAAFVGSYPQASHIFTLTRTAVCVQPSQANPNPTSNYTSTPYLIQVTFTVKWKGVTGRSYSRSSTTLVGNNGLSVIYQRS